MTVKTISLIMVLILAFGSLTLALNIQSANAATITVPDDYPTIQEAINHANEGDTIFVRPGTYHEHIIVNKTVSLSGEQRDSTIIDGNGKQWVVEILANNATISGFTIANGGKNMPQNIIPNGGIKLASNRSVISNNIIAKNGYSGVWTGAPFRTACYNNTIENNLITNNGFYAISIIFPDNTSIVKNNITNNGYGIHIDSGSALLRDNVINDNQYNFGLYGHYESQDIDTSNTVNGKTIYYWIGEMDKAIPPDAGVVYAINSKNITIKDLNLGNLETGLVLVNVTDSFVENLTVSGNWASGILLSHSENNMISHSKIVSNKYSYGIWMQNSNSNIIDSNIISDNQEALSFQNSEENLVTRNEFYNAQGIYLERSGHNVFYYNNMNDTNVNGFESDSTWDNGYSSGGNYWSDYTGIDLYRGLYQNMTGSDGIGDTPYIINENNTDRYPLMNPWRPPILGDMNKDSKVDMNDILIVASAYGSRLGQSRWNGKADINQDGIVDIRDLAVIGKNYGRTNPLPEETNEFYITMAAGSMKPTINVNDTLLVKNVTDGNLIRVGTYGDIIVFKRPDIDGFFVQRAINKTRIDNTWYFRTKGDANLVASYWSGPDTCQGMISENLLVGRVIDIIR